MADADLLSDLRMAPSSSRSSSPSSEDMERYFRDDADSVDDSSSAKPAKSLFAWQFFLAVAALFVVLTSRPGRNAIKRVPRVTEFEYGPLVAQTFAFVVILGMLMFGFSRS